MGLQGSSDGDSRDINSDAARSTTVELRKLLPGLREQVGVQGLKEEATPGHRRGIRRGHRGGHGARWLMWVGKGHRVIKGSCAQGWVMWPKVLTKLTVFESLLSLWLFRGP